MEHDGDGRAGAVVTFGSASLLEDDADTTAARAVLVAALDAGAGRLDTAPMYGHGLTEELVLGLGDERGVPVTTKVGIEPRQRPPRWRRAAVSGVERMPASVRQRIRRAAGAAPLDPFGPSGRFGVAEVRTSIDRSLRRSARIARLLLHEVQPPDVTDELLAVLEQYHARGDVGELGCATRNVITPLVLERGAGLFSVAHVSTAPSGDPVPPVPAGVRLVGHGAFGPGGSDLRQVQRALGSDAELRSTWDAAVQGTPFGAPDGIVRALLARSAAQGVTDLLVATTRVQRAPGLVEAAARPGRLVGDVQTVLERLVARVRGGEGRGAPPC